MRFLLSVIDDGVGAATATEMAAIDAFNERLQDNGQWVFAGGLGAPNPATVIDHRGEEPVVVTGPFAESAEYLAGVWIVEVADHTAAIALATEASKACHRKIEVRPFL